MSTADGVRRIALTLDGTTEAPHFDRTAFKSRRIYATLAADGSTLNLKLSPDQQQMKCLLAPEAYEPVRGAWGASGWTTAMIDRLEASELETVLRLAWENARKTKRRPRKPR
jgi:hypothetical protein